MTIENHPHELWQKQKFGVYHTSQGRRLPVHQAVSREQQEENLRNFEGKEHERTTIHRPFEPVHELIHGARAYNALRGMGDPHAHGYDHIGTHSGAVRDVGRAYDALPDFDKSAVPHFHAMGKEVADQYEHLTKRMGIKVHSVDHDPYKNVHEMVADVRNNKRLKVLSTKTTGGHPFYSNEDNDKFRAVHDAFGHAATGRGFDAHGEEAAFAAHSQMFSHHARPAMVSETRGQNASLHLNGDFGPQKIALLPRHMHVPDLGQLGRTAADWHEYRRMQDAQQRRYERAGVGGGQEEHDQYFGKGEFAGSGVEHKINPKDWMRWSRQESFEDLPPHEQEWHRGHAMGEEHGANAEHADFAEMDRAHEESPHPEHFYDGYVQGLHSTVPKVASMTPIRFAQRLGYAGEAPAEGLRALARTISEDMPSLVVLGHDSGDEEVVFHCPFCGSGQVIARSDGTIECGFCKACFTVQVQPQYPAFPQTIDGVPVNVPGMGPQWPGQEDGPEQMGMDTAAPEEEMEEGEEPPVDEEAPEDDDQPDFLKNSSYRSASGKPLNHDQFLRHVALMTTRDPNKLLQKIRDENTAGRR